MEPNNFTHKICFICSLNTVSIQSILIIFFYEKQGLMVWNFHYFSNPSFQVRTVPHDVTAMQSSCHLRVLFLESSNTAYESV